MLALQLALSAILASPALAHFTLDYPPTRGFDEDIEPQFCGGFNDVSAVRTPYPLGNASFSIDSHHTKATFSIFISLDNNPTNNSDFASLPFVLNYTTIGQGEYCTQVDIGSALAGQNVGNGTNATLLARYDGGDGDLFQCADVVLMTDLTVPANETCSAILASASSTSAAPSASSAAAAASPSASTGGTSGAEGTVKKAGVAAFALGLVSLVSAAL